MSADDIFTIANSIPVRVVQQYALALQEAGVTKASFGRPTIVSELISAGIPPIPAGDIVDAFRKHFVRGPVGVYWDIENVGLPDDVTPLAAVTAMRERIMANFGDIMEFKAYVDLQMYTSKFNPFTRVALGDAGLQIVDATHGGVEMKRKEVADKLIIVDALWFALTNKDATICIISGDSDFSPLLAKLRMRGIRTIVVTASKNVRSLREQATFALRWPEDFLLGCQALAAAPQRNRGAPGFASAGGPPPPPPPPYNGGVSPTRARSPGAGANSGFEVLRQGAVQLAAQQKAPEQPKLTPAALEGPLVEPQPNVAGDTTVSPNAPPEEGQFEDLLSCVKRAQKDAMARKVLRVRVAFYFSCFNPLLSFQEVMSAAIAKGAVKVGGSATSGWIALGTDDVHEDGCSLDKLDTDSTDTLAPRGSSEAGSGSLVGGALAEPEQWWITLRFSDTFRTAQELKSFTDPTRRVQRQTERSSGFHRMALGPFVSSPEANRYFQMKFGHMNLRPKILPYADIRVA